MKAVVPIQDVLPNPYQVRKKYDKESIRALADEIREIGLWSGALRGRMKGGTVELCYGHRRLEALKVLGYDKVDVEIVDLSDDEMAVQSLAENLQREGLTDLEKAEGIAMMQKRFQDRGQSENESLAKVCRIVGLSAAWVKDLLSLLKMEPQVQKAIRDRKIAGRTALEAHRFGGKQMVETAIAKHLPVHKISALSQRVRQIPDTTVRDQVKREVMRGKLVEPESVDEKVRSMLKGRKLRPPEDLDPILASWVERLKEWGEKMDELVPLAKYVKMARSGDSVRQEAGRLASKLQKLL